MHFFIGDLLVGWRLLRAQASWSAVVISGLAIGFAACFLLLIFVKQSLSYDRHIQDHEHIYLVKTRFHFPGVPEQWTAQAPLPIRSAVADLGLGAQVTMFAELERSVRVGDKVLSMPVTIVDAAFPLIFGLTARRGSLEPVLERPDGIALTEDSALRLFGTVDVLGRTLVASGTTLTVGAVLATPPATTTTRYHAMVGPRSAMWQDDDRKDAVDNWGRLFGRIYIKPQNSAGVAAITAALQAASDRSPLHSQLPKDFLAQLGDGKLMDVALSPLADTYLDPDLKASAKPAEHGDRQSLWGLSATAILILGLACLNYVNLAAVRTLRRQREIGVRKVLGAPARRVALQFFGEATLVALLAALVGLLLAWLLLPVFADLMNRRLEGAFAWSTLLACVVASTACGMAAGAYPAWVATRVRPTQALAGRDNRETHTAAWMRRALTAAQFATAMGLTGLTLAVAWQVWHGASVNVGFDADRLLVIDTAPPFTPSGPNTAAFAAAISRLPGVEGVAQSMEAVGRTAITQKNTAKQEGGVAMTVETKGVGVGYFEVYGIPVAAGRGFTLARDGDPLQGPVAPEIVLSHTAMRTLGFANANEAVGKSVEFGSAGQRRQIIGVVNDIRHQSLREPPPPVVYALSRSTPVLTVRANTELGEVQRGIEALWPSCFPADASQMTPARSFIQARYADDVQMTKLLGAAALVAMAIAAFGIYVLAAYSVQRLSLQIVMRKLHGAGPFAIARLVGHEMTVVLLVGAALGLPPAALAIHHYLAVFAEPAPVGGWTLLAALALCVAVAAVAVARHLGVALQLRPALALKA